MKTWKLFIATLMLTGAVAQPAWADADATDGPADATAADAVVPAEDATAADAAAQPDTATAADAGTQPDTATATDAAGGADAASAADTAADGTATSAPGDADSGGGEHHGGCTAGTSASSPVALGVAGAILGWLVSRSRKPAKAPVRNR